MISQHICYTSVNAVPNNVRKPSACPVYSASVASWFLRRKRYSAAYLLVFRSFAHDAQSVLAAVFGFAGVRCERLKYFLVCAVKRRAATFADRQQWIASDNAHFSGTHGYSLAPNACVNETAPVPPISCRIPPQCLGAILLCVINQARESVAQKQLAPVSLSLRQQRKEYVSHLRRNLLCPENFERLGEIEDLRDGRRFFHAPAAQSLRQSCHFCVKLATGIWRSQRNNLCLPFGRGVLNPKIETAPAQRIPYAALLVGCEYHKGKAPGSNRPEFRNAQLPDTQEFQQRGFKCVVHFV